MTINRDNYEEFFILYGDNELGSEDRVRVEAFVRENPDLQQEFAVLNQVRFTPEDDISFDHKESLMQSAGLSKNEELLLLSIDNELTSGQQAELEELLARDKNLQSELDLYKTASFDPNERIVFPYKESLYRKEEARVIPFAWRRFAAAAAILVAVSVTAFIVFNRDGEQGAGLAGISGTVVPVTNGTVKDSNAATQDTNTASYNDGQNTASVKTDSSSVAPHYGHGHDVPVSSSEGVAVSKKENKKQTAPPDKAPVNVKEEQLAKTHNNLPQPLYNPNVAKEIAEKGQLAVNAPSKQTTTSTTQINTDQLVTTRPDDPYKQVVNTMPDPGDDPEDQGPSSKKSKFRGFFRKVTRTFEKNTNIKATDEEDRLLVGGLAIRL